MVEEGGRGRDLCVFRIQRVVCGTGGSAEVSGRSRQISESDGKRKLFRERPSAHRAVLAHCQRKTSRPQFPRPRSEQSKHTRLYGSDARGGQGKWRAVRGSVPAIPTTLR